LAEIVQESLAESVHTPASLCRC